MFVDTSLASTMRKQCYWMFVLLRLYRFPRGVLILLKHNKISTSYFQMTRLQCSEND